MSDRTTASCGRCDGFLGRTQHACAPLMFGLSLLGIVLLGLSLSFPLATVSTHTGRSMQTGVEGGVGAFWTAGHWGLAGVVVLTLLLIPALKLLVFGGLAIGAARRRMPSWVKRLAHFRPHLGGWAMIEVFMLGAAVALTRLEAWMRVELGLAIVALGGAAMCSIGVEHVYDRRAIWGRQPAVDLDRPRRSGLRLLGCAGCGRVCVAEEGMHCPRCQHRLHARKSDSVNRTWALLAAATLMAVPANVLPVMTIVELGRGEPSTIVGGTAELAEYGYWSLAIIVFVASVVVPLLKLVGLGLLLTSVSRGATTRLRFKTKVYRVIAGIGRWSMLDIFATMMLVALAQFDWIGHVEPGVGATAFAAVVLLTMMASESFDSRLMWDAAGKNRRWGGGP